jgi:hypothetical protein
MYSAEISRSQPTAYLFLVDQSGSMADMMSSSPRSKAQFVADVLNKTLRDLVVRCTRDEGVRDYFSVGVVGYGDGGAKNGLTGGLSTNWLNPISQVANGTLRVEERQKMIDDGAGGLAPQAVKFPVWFDAVARGGTPMCDALAKASEVLADWCNVNSNSFPPTVIHITDGESTDGDPENIASMLQQISTNDGGVLLYNLHVSSAGSEPVRFPVSDSVLPNEHAKLLFRMSSLFPEHVRKYAADAHGINLVAESRAMVFNAEAEELVKFLDIGSRPAAMR